MHELSIIKNVMKVVFSEMKKENLTRLVKLKIKVGELTAADADSLKFNFAAVVRGTPSSKAELDIIQAPVTAECPACGKRYRLRGLHCECPACGNAEAGHLNGYEVEIISMEAY